MNIIGIGGGIGSGKSTAAGLYREQGYTVIETSELIQEVLLHEGIAESTRPQRIKKAHELVEQFGKGILGKLACEKALSLSTNNIVICGLRNPEQIFEIRSYFHDALFIFIEASAEIRLERAQKRDAINDSQTLKKLQLMIEDENNPEGNTSMHLPHTRQASTIILSNNSTLEHFRTSISTLFLP